MTTIETPRSLQGTIDAGDICRERGRFERARDAYLSALAVVRRRMDDGERDLADVEERIKEKLEAVQGRPDGGD